MNLLKYCFYACLFFFILPQNANSQLKYSEKDRGIGISTHYSIPTGDLTHVYKPTLSFDVRAYKQFGGEFTFIEVGVGYMKYKPKEEVFYYLINSEEFGTAVYSDYKFIKLYGGLLWFLPLESAFKPMIGMNAGYYGVNFTLESSDPYQEFFYGGGMEFKAALAPKIGFKLDFDKTDISLLFEGQYHLYFSTGQSDPASPNFNSNLGNKDQFYSLGVGVNYTF